VSVPPDVELLWLVRQAFIRSLRSRSRAMARQALIHQLANGISIITANLQALRLDASPEEVEIMADMTVAADRVHRCFDQLRRMG
jgi:hypothetical protein